MAKFTFILIFFIKLKKKFTIFFFLALSIFSKAFLVKQIIKQEAHGPHRSPEKTDHINKQI